MLIGELKGQGLFRFQIGVSGINFIVNNVEGRNKIEELELADGALGLESHLVGVGKIVAQVGAGLQKLIFGCRAERVVIGDLGELKVQ